MPPNTGIVPGSINDAMAKQAKDPTWSPVNDPAFNSPTATAGLDTYIPTLDPETGLARTPGQIAADNLAAQYNAWLEAQQTKNKTQFDTDVLLANSLNGLNGTMLANSTQAQRDLLAQEQYQNRLDQIGNKQQTLSMERERGILGQSYESDMAWIERTWGLAQGQYSADVAHLNAIKGQLGENREFAGRQFGISEDQTNLLRQTNTWQNRSDATARGAMRSEGYDNTRYAIEEQARLGHSGNQLTYDKSLSDIAGQMRDANYQIGNAGRNLQGQQSNLTHQREQTSYTYQKNLNTIQNAIAQNKLAGMALKSVAAQYGIRDRDLQDTLASKLAINGIETATFIQGLTKAYETQDTYLMQQYNQFLAQLLGV